MRPIYVALDLETTGLDSLRDRIIEVGAVKFDDHRVLDQFESLVNPGVPIPLKITQLTGIGDHDVRLAPHFAAVREKLARFVGQSILVGHSVGLDLDFLRRQNCLMHNAALDTFQLAAILMPHESRYSLGKLMDSLGLEFVNRHRALDDARASMLLFRALQERAADLDPGTLKIINRAAQSRHWPLEIVFREAEQRQTRGTFRNSIGAQLRAKGLVDDTAAFARQVPMQPLLPVDQRTLLAVEQLAAMLEEGGALAKTFPGFEYRPQQVDMLRAVAEAFNQSHHLIVEAGTGTGKSLAYLLPAIHWAVQNGERVVISTNTINLQDQLYRKDIPDLRHLFSFDLRAVVLKGRTNYLCMRRLKAWQNRKDLAQDELTVLAKVLAWLPNTVTGDRTELFIPGPREREIWSRISSDADLCTAESCVYRRRGNCFFYRARRAAENAHIIIVNHALLLSDVATENRVLPAYNYLIVDEAHHLEDATTHQLGYTITHRGVSSLLHQIGCSSSRGGLMSTVLARCQGRIPDELWADLQERIGLLGEKNEQLVAELGYLSDELSVFVSEQEGSNRGQYDYRVRLTRSVRIRPEWEQIQVQWARLSRDLLSCLEELDQVNDLIKDLDGLDVPGYDGLLQESLGMGLRLNEVWRQMESVIASPDDNEITWVRARSRPAEISLCAVPLRVDHLVEQHLVWPKEAVVFTSATLRTGDDFAFIKERLGTVDAEELAVGSPFDYESQVLVYLPTDIPEPNQPYHQKVMNRALIQLAEATRGRTLALFTSYSQLGAVSHGISRPLSERGITVYAQGQGASRSQLLENFRETPQAVLLGTRSFWEGIDVPGEALSCLVIAKLPFAVPTDPVFAARSEEMDDPFMQYAVPDAILRFRQGFGRLIRTKTDRGVVVVMDKRVQTKRYGELFLSSLPCCTIVRGSLADLPGQAAMWIDHGVAPPEAESASLQIDDGELEYVPFDEI